VASLEGFALNASMAIENPCVGGSIPPQATKLINPSL
jgi:hypothetical protein